jgi:hypothetical protein
MENNDLAIGIMIAPLVLKEIHMNKNPVNTQRPFGLCLMIAIVFGLAYPHIAKAETRHNASRNEMLKEIYVYAEAPSASSVADVDDGEDVVETPAVEQGTFESRDEKDHDSHPINITSIKVESGGWSRDTDVKEPKES